MSSKVKYRIKKNEADETSPQQVPGGWLYSSWGEGVKRKRRIIGTFRCEWGKWRGALINNEGPSLLDYKSSQE